MGKYNISVANEDTTLQSGRYRTRLARRSVDVFNWPNASSLTMTLPSEQKLTDMSARNLRERWPECEADTSPPYLNELPSKCWNLGLPWTLRAFTADSGDSFSILICYWCSDLTGNTPTGLNDLFRKYYISYIMMLVSYRKHVYGPPRPVTEIVLYLYM
jgi:hypothetical protein